MANKQDLLEEDFLEEETAADEEALRTFGDEEEARERAGSEEIFEGGPTYDQLAEWKSRFRGEIYMTDYEDLGEDIFIWRPLSRKEYRGMNRAEGKDEFYVEESICRTCVLWPEDYSRKSLIYGKAGIPTVLASFITKHSGFDRPVTHRILQEDLEEMEERTVLFDGGPDRDQLLEWTERHEGQIFLSSLGDDYFVWRPLRRKEYKDINRSEGGKDEFYVDEAICKACVLWPENYGQHEMLFGKAGVPTTLSNTITENSGFGRPTTYRMN